MRCMYSYISVGEILRLYETYRDRIIISNGKVIGFEGDK